VIVDETVPLQLTPSQHNITHSNVTEVTDEVKITIEDEGHATEVTDEVKITMEDEGHEEISTFNRIGEFFKNLVSSFSCLP